MLFGLICTLVTWGLLMALGDTAGATFHLTSPGARVVHAFTRAGAGGFIFASALFVSNAALNALGRSMRSTLSNWLPDGVLTLPAALILAGWFGADGAVHAQAPASIVAGSLAALWGWRHVAAMACRSPAPLDLAPVRPYAHVDNSRRR